jgi:hypothetical protein
LPRHPRKTPLFAYRRPYERTLGIRPPIVIVAPMPENPQRHGKSNNWRARDQLRKKYFARLDELQAVGLLPAPPQTPFQKATIHSVMNLGGAMDEDNAMFRHKPLLDWLKTRGYIVDDRRSCLRWEALPEQIVKRDGRYQITLTITAA